MARELVGSGQPPFIIRLVVVGPLHHAPGRLKIQIARVEHTDATNNGEKK